MNCSGTINSFDSITKSLPQHEKEKINFCKGLFFAGLFASHAFWGALCPCLTNSSCRNPPHDKKGEAAYSDPMKHLTMARLPWMALFLSLGLLCGAWFFEHVLGYAPCQMCYWQRHAHKAIIGASILAIIMNRMDTGKPGFWVSVIGLGFIVSAGLAFWHVGVEYKWWEGPKTCMTGTPSLGGMSGADLLSSLDQPIKMPGCTEVAWRFLRLSMATWNMLLSLLGAVMSFISAARFARA